MQPAKIFARAMICRDHVSTPTNIWWMASKEAVESGWRVGGKEKLLGWAAEFDSDDDEAWLLLLYAQLVLQKTELFPSRYHKFNNFAW